jgi:hypothetical protein
MRIFWVSVVFIGCLAVFLLGALGEIYLLTDRQCRWVGYFCGPRTAIENPNHASPGRNAAVSAAPESTSTAAKAVQR